MKGFISTLTILLIFILSSCSNTEVYNHDYKLVGEGDFWKAEFHLKGEELFYEKNGIIKYDSKIGYGSTLTFKGSMEELQSIKRFKYSFEYPSGSFRSNSFDEPLNQPLNDRTFTHTGSGIIARETDTIHVVVNWDDFEESFELKIQR